MAQFGTLWKQLFVWQLSNCGRVLIALLCGCNDDLTTLYSEFTYLDWLTCLLSNWLILWNAYYPCLSLKNLFARSCNNELVVSKFSVVALVVAAVSLSDKVAREKYLFMSRIKHRSINIINSLEAAFKHRIKVSSIPNLMYTTIRINVVKQTLVFLVFSSSEERHD